jgi:hypothetical protein
VSRSKRIGPVDPVNELKFLLLTKVTIPKKSVLPYVNVVSGLNGLKEFGRLEKIGVDQFKFQSRVFNKSVVLLGIKGNIDD